MFYTYFLIILLFLYPFAKHVGAQTMNNQIIKVAAAQVTPVFLNKKATVEKACQFIAEAGKNGAKLVVFPEAFIPGYPDWVWVVSNNKNAMLNELYSELVQNAVTIPD